MTARTLRRACSRLLSVVPFPARLPYGGWFLARNDLVRFPFAMCNLDEGEWRFLATILKSGMTVLDLGASNGFYTVLAAQKVKPGGRVIAFEPSPRERRRLLLNLRVKGLLGRVSVIPNAIGEAPGDAVFFVVQGVNTGFNSLQQVQVAALRATQISVPVTSIDVFLAEQKITRVDFVKMDIAGAELPALRAAGKLLASRPRPLIMAEVGDAHSAGWNYRAPDVYDFFVEQGYNCFQIDAAGGLVPQLRTGPYRANLVAVPAEATPEFL